MPPEFAADSTASTKTSSTFRPRVLLLGWEYAPRLTGGLGTASVRLAHSLAAAVNLSVVVPRLPDEPDAPDEAAPSLTELATAPADGPDQLRHFPASADWSAERPRRPAPSPPPYTGPLADDDGAPAAPHDAPAQGRPVRLTALSHLTPVDVRAATVPPRPPRYEVFARQVRHVALGVLPYAEAPDDTANSSAAPAEAPGSAAVSGSKNIGAPMFSGEILSENVEAPMFTGEALSENIETPMFSGEALSKHIEAPMFSPGASGSDPEPRGSDPLTESLAPFQVPVVPRLNPLTLPSSNTEVVQFARLAARITSGDEMDVVYAHDWPTFLAGVEIRLARKVPLVLHVHSTSFDRHGPPPQGWVFELERAAFRAADRVVAVSRYGAQVLREQYGVDDSRLRVVHHGLSAGPLGPQWEARPVGAAPTVLFVGRLTSQKNALGFVEVARLVAAQLPEARFAIAGDGPQRAAVQAAAEAAGLTADRFELLGFLDDEAVSAALAAAAVVCLPARSEPFGLAALEAAAAGVPLVLSTTTGAAEVLPGALTAGFDDAPALAAHVLTLLRDEPARRRAVRENAAAARRLTWEKAAEEVLGVLEEVTK